jgi:ribonuclease HI
MLQMSRQSRYSTEDRRVRPGPIFFMLWKSFHATDTKEPRKPLDGMHHLHAWCTQEVRIHMSDLIAYVDGSSHGSPGPSGIGIIVEDPEGGRMRIGKWIGWQDNNVAEYVALLEALQCALSRKAQSLLVYSDSDVVVRQMSGEYACRSPRLYSLHWICRKLARNFEFAITRIPRDRNTEANRLANSAARQCRNISEN